MYVPGRKRLAKVDAPTAGISINRHEFSLEQRQLVAVGGGFDEGGRVELPASPVEAEPTGRDGEAARAVELAGGAPEIVHMNQLRAKDRSFSDYDALLLPGGFSYGDALGAGARLALDMNIFF